MSDHAGEKTEQPTPRRLEDALKRGQIARSPEVQTVFVLLGGLAALSFAGHETWQTLANATVAMLGHLHDTSISSSSLQGYVASGMLLVVKCAGPIVLATAVAGLLAGAIQNRFTTASEAMTPNWDRINPIEGFKRVFSINTLVPTASALLKLAFIILLTYSEVRTILSDPIFTTSVSVGRIAEFLATTWIRIIFRISLVLLVIAAADYGYQWWKTRRELMMSREELREEMKNNEGNQQIKAARRRRRAPSKAKMLAEIPKADVVVTNPTHIAIALRYDRKTMRAPKVVAKGIRLNAQLIRELAQKHQVPILENKPLARMLFKHGRVGGEVPAQFYSAVAEVLAWVYRVNRYRYYTEQNQV
jgi:flagellar biosynthesis protein FlhB